MTGEWICPIYYQGVVSLEKGTVIIVCKLPELTKNISEAGSPALPQPCFKHDYAGSGTLLSHSHVSSMAGGCTCLIYYQGVVSLEKGSVIIRYKLPGLSKKVPEAENLPLPQPRFKHDFGGG